MYCAFDLETGKLAPKEKTSGPMNLGISCAATMLTGKKPKTWWCGMETIDYGSPAMMSKEQAQELVGYLINQSNMGYVPLTWNGLGFDFVVLAEESGLWKECAQLALGSVDMMFQFYCIKGYPLGMQAAALGQGLSGKTEGMGGKLAPEMWQGTDEERMKVLEYVGQDARTTLQLGEAILARRMVAWTSKAGKAQTVAMPRFFSAQECLKMPVPDTSWMTKSSDREEMSRETFTGWALRTLGI